MKKTVIVSLIFLILTAVFTYPSVFQLKEKIIGDGGDNYQFLAFQYLSNMQFEKGQLPFGWTNYWRYPVGFDFSNSYDGAFLMVVGIFFYRFFHDPVVVYNLSVLLLLFISSYLSYLFFRNAVEDEVLGITGGLIYGFSFYNLARMGGHPNLVMTGCFPFFFYALHKFGQRAGDKTGFALLGLSVVLVFLTSLQYLLVLAGGLIFILPLIFLFYRDTFNYYLLLFWRRKTSSIMTSLSVLSVFLYFNYQKFSGLFTKTFELPGAEIVSPSVANFFMPNSYLKLAMGSFSNSTEMWIENAIFLGFLEMLFLVFFILQKGISLKFRTFLISILGIFFIISLGEGSGGNNFLPYPFLFRFMPFRGIVEPARFYIFMYMVITLCFVLYMKKFIKSTGTIGITTVLLFLIFERMPNGFYESSTLASENFIESVKASQSTAVMDLPLFLEWNKGNFYDLYSVYYAKPVINGYIHWSGATPQTKLFTDILKRFECSTDPAFEPKQLTREQISEEINLNRQLLPYLRGYGIRTFVFHRDFTEGTRECAEVYQRIYVLLNYSNLNLRNLYADGYKEVYYLND